MNPTAASTADELVKWALDDLYSEDPIPSISQVFATLAIVKKLEEVRLELQALREWGMKGWGK